MAPHDPAAAEDLLALLDCLQSEYAALLAQDLPLIESALVRKERLLARLASHAERAVARKCSGAGGLPPAWGPALLRARSLNERNALVLRPRKLANGARLRFLQSALGGLALYGADGLATHGRPLTTPAQGA
jgi:flagellar biosynthesis/type III secretory pathway chaperone